LFPERVCLDGAAGFEQRGQARVPVYRQYSVIWIGACRNEVGDVLGAVLREYVFMVGPKPVMNRREFSGLGRENSQLVLGGVGLGGLC